MTVPSPRKFIEITLALMVALIFLASFAVVVFVMVLFAMIEGLVDRLRFKTRVRR